MLIHFGFRQVHRCGHVIWMDFHIGLFCLSLLLGLYYLTDCNRYSVLLILLCSVHLGALFLQQVAIITS